MAFYKKTAFFYAWKEEINFGKCSLSAQPTGPEAGLELPLVHHNVKAFGGTINVKPKEDKGAEFIIQPGI